MGYRESKHHNARRDACDTIVVPARKKGFNDVFLKQGQWYAVRISPKRLSQVKYVAAYQVAPIGLVTHIAEVLSIEPYLNSEKYRLIFKGEPEKIRPVPKGDTNIQGPIYVERSKLLVASSVKEAILS